MLSKVLLSLCLASSTSTTAPTENDVVELLQVYKPEVKSEGDNDIVEMMQVGKPVVNSAHNQTMVGHVNKTETKPKWLLWIEEARVRLHISKTEFGAGIPVSQNRIF